MLKDQSIISISNSMKEYFINSGYINNFKQIVEKMCKEHHEDFYFISTRLMHVGFELTSHKLFDSFNRLLDIFDLMIDFELKIFEGISHKDKYRLINIERSLMYIWCKCQSQIPAQSSDKIIRIFKKIKVKPLYISETLLIAYGKTDEWLKSDELRKNLENLMKNIDEQSIIE